MDDFEDLDDFLNYAPDGEEQDEVEFNPNIDLDIVDQDDSYMEDEDVEEFDVSDIDVSDIDADPVFGSTVDDEEDDFPFEVSEAVRIPVIPESDAVLEEDEQSVLDSMGGNPAHEVTDGGVLDQPADVSSTAVEETATFNPTGESAVEEESTVDPLRGGGSDFVIDILCDTFLEDIDADSA